MMPEFDFAQIAQWLNCQERPSGKVRGFKQDSRDVLPGDLFFALKGEKVDGHCYLQEVASKGAIGAVVNTDYSGEHFGLTLLAVPDVMAGLHTLAKTVHALRNVRVVGVTGSVGKTTVKEFIATLLAGKYRVNKTPGNANSQVGVPLSILNSSGEEEIFVLEMGMTGRHEIEKLVNIAPPEVAVITKLALAHALFFPDGLKGIAAAKGEIFSHPHTRHRILSRETAQYFAPDPSFSTFGSEAEEVDLALCHTAEGYHIREKTERTPSFALPFTASHLSENFTAAFAVARAMEMHSSEILPQIPHLKVFKRRFEKVEHRGIVFLNDSYNANAVSMRAALLNLPKPIPGGKRVAVLGAMKELGPFTEDCHREVAEVALSSIDHLLCLGEECLTMVDIFKKAGKPAEYFEALEPLKCRVFELAAAGDVVLLKGSNSKKMWLILED
jgi:UDP-N-acetylmuramoyl-tripeptide--D-alanyl-D-alanine ligase